MSVYKDPSHELQNELLSGESLVKTWSIGIKGYGNKVELNADKSVRDIEELYSSFGKASGDLQEEIAKLKSLLEQKVDEQAALTKEITSLKAEVESTRPALEQLEHLANEKTRTAQDSLAALQSKQRQLELKLQHIQKATTMYSYLLGVTVTPNRQDNFTVVFRRVDPDDASKAFTFTFETTRQNRFRLLETTPPLSFAQDERKALESTQSFAEFLWLVRSKFKDSL